MEMRLRLPELLKARKPPMTPYALAKASGGRISLSTIYRLTRQRGQVATFDAELLEALCDVLDCEPGELLEREPKRRK
jgi:DNA-binding Xre family transcriptional regulator